MAVPLKLRDERIMQAVTNGDGVMTCDRCHMPLSMPAKSGYKRQQTNARVRYIVLPGYGGEKTVDNAALLCGDCEPEYKNIQIVHKMFYTKWCAEYEGVAVSEEQDAIDAGGDWQEVSKQGDGHSGTSEADDATPDTHSEGAWAGSTGADQTFFKEEDEK